MERLINTEIIFGIQDHIASEWEVRARILVNQPLIHTLSPHGSFFQQIFPECYYVPIMEMYTGDNEKYNIKW